ncbi:MAG TPA: hypothetical protein VFW71_13685 [Actinomycetota bacterium]|nr:hypothetical protein [Actinomycetota bacterium]
MGAAASLSPSTVAVEPGAEAGAEIKIRNTGHVVDEFTLDVVGEPAAWSSVEPPSLSLLPGTEGTARVSFRPPRASEVRAGTFPFGVRVRSKEDPEGSVTEEGTLNVGSFKDLFGELLPRTAHGTREAHYDLAVDNRGNLGLNADLEGIDPNAVLRFRFSPPSLVTNPNTATFTRLAVRPVKPFWKGPPRSHPFQVAIKPASAPPVLLDGVMLQESILPPWFMKALAAVLALAVLAVVAWLALVKPQIKSAANTAVAAPLASEKAQVASLASGQKALNDAVAPIIGHSVVTPTVSPSPTGPVGATALGNPFYSRLPTSQNFPAGQTKSDSYAVPANNTLSVSDIVMENPAGDSGTLTIQVVNGSSTSTLLVESLDNFRDLDYHFISPPTLPGGQKFQMTVQCTAGGTGGASPPPANKPCTPSLFFSGFLKQGS